MDAVFSSCQRRILLRLVTCLILTVVTTNAKVKGTFKCTQPARRVITCSTTNLPTASNGSFDCPSNSDVSEGGICTLTCNDGHYLAAFNRTVCEAGTAGQGGKWSNGSFVCRAITCSTTNLPTVSNGSFDCPSNSDVSEGGTCALTCNDGHYSAAFNRTVCEAGTAGQGGKWSNGSFVCRAITCSTTNLPTVSNGSFDCPSNSDVSEGGTCALTCNDGHYSAAFNPTVCEAGTAGQGGKWSNGSFVCRECNEWNKWNGSEYKFITTYQTWDKSRQLCVDDRAHLVNIENEEENSFVQKVVLHCVNIGTWIGLNNKKGMWEWSDGTVATYRNFAEGRPFAGMQKNCVRIGRKSGTWNDRPCDHDRPAVCERT